MNEREFAKTMLRRLLSANKQSPALVKSALFGKDERSALHVAAKFEDDLEVFNKLFAFGLNPNAVNTFGETPLHLAAEFNRNPSVIECLIMNGADPNCRCGRGFAGNLETPLHKVVRGTKELAVVRSLLNLGADPNVSASSAGCTSLILALIYGAPFAVVEALVCHGADLGVRMDDLALLHHASGHNADPAVIQFLINTGQNVNVTDVYGETPLHYAAAEGSSAVEVLLTNGSDPNQASRSGATPLHHAAERNYPDCIQLLLANGANPSARTQQGKTPLDYASEHVEIRTHPVWKLLQCSDNADALPGQDHIPREVQHCRQCGQRVRFPAGRRLKITCPKCRTTWISE